MLKISIGFVLAATLSVTALIGCNGASPDDAESTTSSEALSTPSVSLKCEIHYYDSASLPTPHIFVAASGVSTAKDLATKPLTLSTPEGVSAWLDVAQAGYLTVSVGTSTQPFAASGTYLLSTSKHFATDLQTSIAPVQKDGITYDRMWVGCFPQ